MDYESILNKPKSNKNNYDFALEETRTNFQSIISQIFDLAKFKYFSLLQCRK